ncbi:MAG: rRNA maturation RNase YbeY [Saprospiraceae bacterium]|jgi:rRNA maturation RNase YbeY|nr:rRNA maturation RNase YbeY [Saprospiraceae bacterium]HRD81018.1 rRNA maturation RNase YbeY [Saprospiraceae bacterium]HRF40147.1 rRNA maturation RNase YbeY [Saprospiraceae bacterium]HRK83462.1 rRNA maturation RNase YbeY [Saprospiraceae bacterium]
MVEPYNEEPVKGAPYQDEDEERIQFHFEDTEFELLYPARLRQWIEQVIARESCILQTVSFIFCSDDYLYDLNVQYLSHDTLTDVITFPYLKPPHIEGDIFISADRIRDNAGEFGVSFEQELHRVMIHGILHLCGYSDKTDADKAAMTQKEDEALGVLRDLS